MYSAYTYVYPFSVCILIFFDLLSHRQDLCIYNCVSFPCIYQHVLYPGTCVRVHEKLVTLTQPASQVRTRTTYEKSCDIPNSSSSSRTTGINFNLSLVPSTEVWLGDTFSVPFVLLQQKEAIVRSLAIVNF